MDVGAKISRILLPILYWCTIAGAALAAGWPGTDSLQSLLLKLGRAAGLMAFVMLSYQAVLTCRLKWLDRLFAIDRITNYHKGMGITVTCLLIAHLSLILAASQSTRLLSMNTPWQVNLGKAALSVVLVIVILALTFEAFGIDYNIWRLSHKLALFIAPLGFLHSWFIGDEVHDTPLKYFWLLLLLIVALAAAYRNIYIPFFARRLYRVDSVRPQNHNTYTLTLRPDKNPISLHRPGQFAFLKLKRPGRKSEIHPFTIASSPTSAPHLQFTIKQSGNYTNTIDQTKTTDTALIEGPYGKFSLLNYPAGPLLFIAGGVGITPLMSMVRYLRDNNDPRPVLLLYGNRTLKDILFEDELSKLPDNFKTVHVLSQPDPQWTGPKGHITAAMIEEFARPVLTTAQVFLCGPPPMMDKVIAFLRQLSVAAARVHYERFSI